MAIKFPVIHGINLAPGSTAQNFVFESLTSDPLPAVAGRVWLNTTTKAFKYSTLDNTGAVIVKTFASAEALNADIANLQAQLDSAAALSLVTTDALDARLVAEVTRATGVESANAIAAHAYIDAQVAALVDGAPAAVNAEAATAAVNAEAARATGVEAGIAADVALEVTNRGAAVLDESIARIAGDTGLDNRLTTVEGQVNGKIGYLSTLTTVDKSSVVNSIIEVNTNVSIEKSRSIAAEGVLTADLATEVSTARAAELVLTTDLATEVTRAKAAEVAEASTARAAELVLTNNLATEATTARAAEAAELARATAAEGVLTADLATEVAARGTADALIRSDYNAKAFSYVSAAPAMQHTIAHSLNTASYLVNILVKGADGVFRNDTVPYEETDANNFVVYLAFAADIRVSVKSLASL